MIIASTVALEPWFHNMSTQEKYRLLPNPSKEGWQPHESIEAFFCLDQVPFLPLSQDRNQVPLRWSSSEVTPISALAPSLSLLNILLLHCICNSHAPLDDVSQPLLESWWPGSHILQKVSTYLIVFLLDRSWKLNMMNAMKKSFFKFKIKLFI